MGDAGNRVPPDRLYPPPPNPGLIERPRLFKSIDRLPGGAAMWLWGPPGCGKSSLASTYLGVRQCAGLWLTIPTPPPSQQTLTSRLAGAIHARWHIPPPPPPTRPEAVGPWARSLFARLPRFTLVLDDMHNAGRPLAAAIAAIVQALPPSGRALLISRSEPPRSLKKALGSALLTTIGWPRLRMDRAEVERAARATGRPLDREAVSSLYEASGGWAAAVDHMLRKAPLAPLLAGALPDALAQPPQPEAPVSSRPVAIHALGPFRIHTAEGPLPRFRKPPKRPLDLARMLVAAGPAGTAEARVTDALWPDAEGDAAQRSLATTLHRLRTLLHHGDAVIRENGWLSLDTERVWVDAWFLEGELANLPNGAPLNAGQAAQLARLLALYQGPLLSADGDAPWLLAARERLHGQVVTALTRLGRYHEAAADWAAAEAVYRQGIALEPESKPICHGLMRSLAAQGRDTEADTLARRLSGQA